MNPEIEAILEQKVQEAIDAQSADPAPEPGPLDQGLSLDIDPDDIKRSLGQLVMTVVRLLHELMERQAIRRAEGGSLSDKEVERVGRTLMLQAQEIDRLAEHFGLTRDDLNLDLGPLGTLV